MEARRTLCRFDGSSAADLVARLVAQSALRAELPRTALRLSGRAPCPRGSRLARSRCASSVGASLHATAALVLRSASPVAPVPHLAAGDDAGHCELDRVLGMAIESGTVCVGGIESGNRTDLGRQFSLPAGARSRPILALPVTLSRAIARRLYDPHAAAPGYDAECSHRKIIAPGPA